MDIPELPAYLDTRFPDVNLWHVWCQYCHRWHTHGAGGKDANPMEFLGHRVAHCTRGGPYDATGYRLVYGGLWQELPVTVRRRGLR